MTEPLEPWLLKMAELIERNRGKVEKTHFFFMSNVFCLYRKHVMSQIYFSIII